jgi:cytochrome c
MRAPVLLVLVVLLGAAACRGPDEPRRPVPAGDAERGRALIQAYGCGACHTIPGVEGARAVVGPPLWGIADRAYIGGVVPNTEADMIRWLQNPQAITPRTVMPNMGVTEADARDIAAYLSTLRAEPAALRIVRGFIERAMGRSQ